MDEILASLKKAGRCAFRTKEYAALLGKKEYARLVLHRLKEKGGITSVRNGWWAFSGSIPEAVACEISKPCYVSFHSALFLHGLTTQTPRVIQIAVTRRTRAYTLFGMVVKEFKMLKKSFNNFYAKEGVLLASPEKAFADCISLPRSCPEIVLFEALDKIDIEKVRSLLSTNAALKRFGRVIQNAR
ncbi:MAG: hypothetical protein AB1391_02795 [Candidatus Micrarchaeota archaeon]